MQTNPKVEIQYFKAVGEDYDLMVNYGRSWRPLCQEAFLPEPGPMNPEPLPPYRAWQKRKVRVVKFPEYTLVPAAEQFITEERFETADLWMLLTFAARFPDIQTSYPILATGTPVRFANGINETLIPCLRWDGFIRRQRFGTVVPSKKEKKRTLEFLPKQYGFESSYYYLASVPLPK